MLILAAATDQLEISQLANPAAGLSCTMSYREVTDDTNASYKPRPHAMLATTAASQVLLAPPPAGFTRLVDYLNIYNPNAANATVTVWQSIGGVDYPMKKVVLSQDESLEYIDGVGWRVLTSAGSVKTSINQGNNAIVSGQGLVILGADVTNNNAVANSIQDITGLAVPLVAGQRMAFEAWIRYTAAATTTGARFTVTGPSFDELTYDSSLPLTTTSETPNRSNAAYDLPAASNASSAQTTLGNLAVVRGIIRPTANGNLQFRFASEIASSAIVAKAGSHVKHWNLN